MFVYHNFHWDTFSFSLQKEAHIPFQYPCGLVMFLLIYSFPLPWLSVKYCNTHNVCCYSCSFLWVFFFLCHSREMLLEEIIKCKVIWRTLQFPQNSSWKVIQNPISSGKDALLEFLGKVKGLLLWQILQRLICEKEVHFFWP